MCIRDSSKVVTFTRDISEYSRFRDMYERLMNKIDQYNRTINELAYKEAIIEDFHTDNRACLLYTSRCV